MVDESGLRRREWAREGRQQRRLRVQNPRDGRRQDIRLPMALLHQSLVPALTPLLALVLVAARAPQVVAELQALEVGAEPFYEDLRPNELTAFLATLLRQAARRNLSVRFGLSRR
ncbi:Protein of unknown function [Gryllus bimaculatus]|nr:Protein of unknown function [Gryllus bimaculatus]